MSDYVLSNKTVGNIISYQEIHIPSSVSAGGAGETIRASLSNEVISSVGSAETYFYLQDQMQIDASEIDFAIGEIAPADLKAYAFWKIDSVHNATFNRDYVSIPLNPTVVFAGYRKIIFSISEDVFSRIKSISDMTGVRFGFITFTISPTSAPVITFLAKLSTNPMHSTEIYTISPDIEGVFKTPAISFETFFIPDISASFVYNFFETNESDLSSYLERDYKNKKLSDIPKYMLVSWNKAPSAPIAIVPPTTPIGAGPGAFLPTIAGSSGYGGGSPTVATTPSPSIIRLPGLILSSGINAALAGIVLSPSETRTGPATPSSGVSIIPSASGIGIGVSTIGGSTPSSDLRHVVPGAADISVFRDVPSDYVGYIIEKERLNEDTQDFEKMEDIIISNKDLTFYADTRIAYSETYRYRIRSIYRFVNKDNLDIFLENERSQVTATQEASVLPGNAFAPTFFYDSENSEPYEATAVENIRPNAPDNLQFILDSKEKSIFLTWNQKNKNNDVAGYSVYRKDNTINSIFQKQNIDFIQPRNNFYKDYSIEINKEYIYAVGSIDRHGNYSLLSSQFIVSITNLDSEIGRVERKIKLFKFKGEELYNSTVDIPPKFITRFKKKIKIDINPLYLTSEADAIFVLRFVSLDTLQQKEVKLNFVTKVINHTTFILDAPQRAAPTFRPASRFTFRG